MLMYIILGTKEFGPQSADFIQKVFASRYGDILVCKCILGWDITQIKVKSALTEINTYLSLPEKQAIIYYNGHGDRIPGKNGMIEIWRLMGGGQISSEDISKSLTRINESSYLWLISDSCSSGKMIDNTFNSCPWITLSSCKINQDSLASIDGGIFTLFGLLPAVQQCDNIREIHNYILNNVVIPTQTSQLRTTRDVLLDRKIFPLPATFISLRPLLKEMLKVKWVSVLYCLPHQVQYNLLKELHSELNSETSFNISFDNFRRKYINAGVNQGYLHSDNYLPLYPFSITQTEIFLKYIAN